MKPILFANGTIVTMEAEEQPQALLVKDGRIAALGEYKELKRLAADAEEVDLNGGSLTPGFVDGHSHIAQFASTLRFAALNGVRSFEELIAALKDFARKAKLGANDWIVGVGYDPELLKEHAHPLRQVLDRISQPVLVSHASGHMGCLNSAALAAAGISEQTQAPSGGVIGREADGRPNGYLEENAFMRLGSVLASPTLEDRLKLLERAQELYLSYGVTSAQEGMLKEDEFDLLSAADERDRLLLDVLGYADIRTDLLHRHRDWLADSEQAQRDLLVEGMRREESLRAHFRIGGYKLFLDGSPQGRTAWLTQPYTPAEGQPNDYRGYAIFSDEEVRAFVQQAARENRQLLTHCNGDAAIDQLLSAHDQPSQTRNVIVHAQCMRLNQLPEVKRLRLIPSYFVAHTYHYGDAHLRNLGRARAERISPVADTVALQIPYTLHQDTPVMEPNMLETAWCAMNRVTRAGESLDGGEKISLLQALRGMTSYGAYEAFAENEKGSLKVGKQADLALFPFDVLRATDEQLRGGKARAVYRAGRLVWQA